MKFFQKWIALLVFVCIELYGYRYELEELSIDESKVIWIKSGFQTLLLANIWLTWHFVSLLIKTLVITSIHKDRIFSGGKFTSV